MMVCLFVLFFFFRVSLSEHWAVIVAGSRGYSNYRHQANACQFFHQLNESGIHTDKIIVFQYDDIAHSIRNPHKGKVINYIGGPNVYPNCPKDYTGKHVNPKNFLKVLKGEEMTVGSGKTLKSTENDKVLIFFTDHGSPGALMFPFFQECHGKDLISTLKYMKENKMFSEMLFFAEACFSGSIFNGHIPEDWKILVIASTSPNQEGRVCDYSSKEAGGVYINDCFSKNLFNDTRIAIESKTFHTRTIYEQFVEVRKKTKKDAEKQEETQIACIYGDQSFINSTIDKFQGEFDNKRNIDEKKTRENLKRTSSPSPYEIHLKYLMDQVKFFPNDIEKLKELENYENHVRKVDNFWTSFKEEFNLRLDFPKEKDTCQDKPVLDLDCMKRLYNTHRKWCGRFDEYSLKYTPLLQSICNLHKDVGDYFKDHC